MHSASTTRKISASRTLSAALQPDPKAHSSPTSNTLSNSSAEAEAQDATRLYISPFTQEFLPLILPSKQQQALLDEPTYHHPQTNPSTTFGYITISTSAAHTLCKKFNGTILKGQKMRVEEARPDRGAKRKADAANGEEPQNGGKRTRRSTRQGKEADGVLKGVELQKGRKVKRGWEDGWVGADESMGDLKRGGKKKARAGDANANKPAEDADAEAKIVFRTQVPPNKDVCEADTDAKSNKNKKKKVQAGATEVKEFGKTEPIPTFTRESNTTNNSRKYAKFEDEKGWVDEEGKVVEEVKESGRASKRGKKTGIRSKKEEKSAATAPPVGPDVSVNGNKEVQANEKESPTPQIALDATSTVDETANDADGASNPSPSNNDASSTLETLFKRPNSASKSKSKRPEPIKTFSFFDNATEDATTADGAKQTPDPDDPMPGAPPTSNPLVHQDSGPLRKKPTRLSALQIPPQTPFTRRDLDARGLRSAAPTPDTAAIGKRMRMPWLQGRSQTRSLSREADGSRSMSREAEASGESGKKRMKQESLEADGVLQGVQEEDEDEDEDAGPVPPEGEEQEDADGEKGAQKEQTEFEKQFYAQRGELNRSWKAQRREAKKQGKKVRGRRGA